MARGFPRRWPRLSWAADLTALPGCSCCQGLCREKMMPMGLDLGPQGRVGVQSTREAIWMCLWCLGGGGRLPPSSPAALGWIVIVAPLRWKGRNFDTSYECRKKRFSLPWGLKTALSLANVACSKSGSQNSLDPRTRTTLCTLKWALFRKSEIIAPASFFRSCHFFLI